MLSKLATRRLAKLADYMAKLPKSAKKHFDMSCFADHVGMDEHKFPEIISKKELNYCGTTACALGWASTIPSFKRAGLELIYDEYMGFQLHFKGEDLQFGWSNDDNIEQFLPGIGPEKAEYLFGAKVRIKTPKQWAKRCRIFLKVDAKQELQGETK